ncbi:putative HTH-type transcriptional regulator YdfH [Pseudovibrio axinellae]|uniref:Putative HTH-type transcriptional regulator YdfH n=1 Tax=Pseudovibrio axinellae TaxID=989403 RepID=A0A165YW25_9HYPH|nr:GntR family transcriptional regulator [Pseudovibrio axinellae]KZL19286.1 putative HTH-type transcriptional regulator YdfH [Pseudovibrio axinellae]SEQ42835.1 DNA-binding transcriptional regulator, GntR family [Pseudovibrio axinellae]
MPSSTSNVAIAYRKLKQAILENHLGPGAQVLEQEAATQLEMSRTPVREAMLMLQKDGLVEMRPRQGMRVLPITAGDISEIYEILEVVEGLAIRKLAERTVSEKQLTSLEDSITLMELSIERGDLSVWASADKRFHEDIVKFSGNIHLVSVFQQLWERSQRARNMLLKTYGTPVNSNQEHRDLLKLINEGKAHEAVEFQKNLRTAAADKIRKMIFEIMEGMVLPQ